MYKISSQYVKKEKFAFSGGIGGWGIELRSI